VPRRRPLRYCPLSESRSLYRPRHAAPTLLLRLARQLIHGVIWTRQVVGYYPPPRHRRQPAVTWASRLGLGSTPVAAQRGLGGYPVFASGQVRGGRGVLQARA
jgi:hypothetical protein